MKNVPRRDLLRGIKDTIDMISQTWDRLRESDLQKEYPVVVRGRATSQNLCWFTWSPIWPTTPARSIITAGWCTCRQVRCSRVYQFVIQANPNLMANGRV